MFTSGLFTSNNYISKLIDIDSDKANNDLLANKLVLENTVDEKKKIEVGAEYKKARARLIRFLILINFYILMFLFYYY